MRNSRGRRAPDRPEGAVDQLSIHAEDVRRSRDLLDGVNHQAAADLFGALADPSRLRLVHVLLQQEMCTSDLSVTIRLAESVVSQHLRVLRNLGLVTPRRSGRVVYYRLESRDIARIVLIGLRLRGDVAADVRLTAPHPAGRVASGPG